MEIPLAAFGSGWFLQSNHARATRIQVFHEAFDGTAFTGCVAAFKQADDTLTGIFNPALYFQQFDLQLLFFFFVNRAAHTLFVRVVGRKRCAAGIFVSAASFVFQNSLFEYLQLVLFLAQFNILERF